MANYATLIRRPWESGHTPFRRATTYARIKDGLFPPAIKIGRMSVWLDRELSAVNEAIVAGVPDDDLRAYIANLVEQRGAPEGVVVDLSPIKDDE